MLRLLSIPVLCACLALFACAKPPAPPPEPPTATAVTPEPPPPCKRAERIDVSKSQRVLTVRCVGGATLTYPIALSRERGAKRVQGDQRMPEGAYRISGPARRSSRFHLFMPFSYPSRADADRGLREGLINKEEHTAIVRAHRDGRLPPQNTALGGALGIHGEGARWKGDLALNWTLGCIAMTDRSMTELAKLVRPGTTLQISP